MSDRATGRTTRQMQALPDGSIYVVAHHAERQHCRGLLVDMGRRSDSLRIVTLEQVKYGQVLRGLPRSTVMDVDHYVYESGINGSLRAELAQWLDRYAAPEPAIRNSEQE